MNEVPRLSVDIVSDVMCPWCIIGWLKFRKVMAHFEGRLGGVENDAIVIETTPGKRQLIPLALVTRARLEVEF